MTQYTAPIAPTSTYPQNPQVGDTYINSSNSSKYEYTSLGWIVSQHGEEDVDWFGERHNERYIFRRVSWDAWQKEIALQAEGIYVSVPDEIGEIGNITSGTVSLSALNDLKASCDFEFEGGEPPNPNELIRIYYTFEDGKGRDLDASNDNPRNRPAVLGTFFPVYNNVSYEENYDASGERKLLLSGTVSGDSVLSVVLNKKLGMPLTIPAGTPTLEYVDKTLKSLGLRTNNPQYIEEGKTEPSLSKKPNTFEPDDPIVTVLNWCLRNTVPRYRALYVDPYGIVQISKYVDVESTIPIESFAHVFKTDEYSIVQRGITSDNDWQTTPNVCRVAYTNDEISMWAVSKNITGSRFSLDARGGREITVEGDVEELEGDTPEEMLGNLMYRCHYRLEENSSEIEHTTFTHAYISWLQPNDPIALDYVNMWTGYITNLDITLAPSTQCQTKMRRFLPNSIVYETYGDILWQQLPAEE